MYIDIEDLKTHIYGENADEIARDDDDIIQEAIDGGIAEAQGFLSRFDLDALFGVTGGPSYIPPTVVDVNLKSKVKDLIKWHLIRLGNPNINYDDAMKRYEYAIEYYFNKIQRGHIMPKDWVYKDMSEVAQKPEGLAITHFTQTQRDNNMF